MAQHTPHAASPRPAPARPRAWHEDEHHPQQHLSSAQSSLDLLLWTLRGTLLALLGAAVAHMIFGTTPTGRPATGTGLFLAIAGAMAFSSLGIATAWRRDRRRARHLTAFLHKA